MSAPSLPDRPGLPAVPLPRLDPEHPGVSACGPDCGAADVGKSDEVALADLAGRWATLAGAQAVRPNLRPRLTGLLRRLAAASRDEP